MVCRGLRSLVSGLTARHGFHGPGLWPGFAHPRRIGSPGAGFKSGIRCAGFRTVRLESLTMSTAPPLDTSISISSDPATLDAVRTRYIIGTNADGSDVLHPAFTAARGAMEAAYTRSLTMSGAERALREQRNADPAQQRRLRAGVEKSLSESRKAIGTALESISSHRAKLEESIVETLGIPTMRTSITDSQRGADVRAALRAMGESARREAIRTAIQAGDREAVSAVLAASPLASGLSRNDLEGIRMDAERKFSPREAEMRDNLDKLRELVARGGDAVESRFAPLVGRGDDPSARAESALRALEGGAA